MTAFWAKLSRDKPAGGVTLARWSKVVSGMRVVLTQDETLSTCENRLRACGLAAMLRAFDDGQARSTTSAGGEFPLRELRQIRQRNELGLGARSEGGGAEMNPTGGRDGLIEIGDEGWDDLRKSETWTLVLFGSPGCAPCAVQRSRMPEYLSEIGRVADVGGRYCDVSHVSQRVLDEAFVRSVPALRLVSKAGVEALATSCVVEWAVRRVVR